MTEYTKLSQTLQKTINMHVDDTLYPRKCLIKNVYDDGNVDAVVVIGEETLFTNLICFGDGKIGDEGIFIPLLNDYNQNIVITDNIKTYSKKEIDSKIDELNEAFETQLTADYIQSLIDALEKEDEKLNQRINNITADLDNVSADVLKKEDKANKVSDITDESTDVQYPTAKAVYDKFNSIIDIVYPVGSIYMSANSVSPKVLFGGEWERLKDAFLLASGDVYEAGSTGGSATVTLTEEQMPSHTHIQNPHNHTQNSHNHSQNAHSHHTSENDEYFVTSESNGANNTRVQYNSNGNRYVDGMTTSSTPFHHRTATQSVTATNQSATATNQETTATNQNTGGGQPHDNMPPYLSIYAWKRIS